MNKFTLMLVAVSVAFANATSAFADFLIYTVTPELPRIVIEGRINNHGNTVTLIHPKFGATDLNRYQCEFIEVPERRGRIRRELSQFAREGEVEDVYKMSVQCLKHGWVDDFIACMHKVLEMDSQHEGAKRVLALAERIDQPIEESSLQEQKLRDAVPYEKMRFERSAHFLMLTDTPKPRVKGEKFNRAQLRLALLEQVYKTFLYFFCFHGIELEVPKERLLVVLFDEHRDYVNYATSISPGLQSTAGFYDPISGISYFYDHASDELGRFLNKQLREMESLREDLIRSKAPGRGDVIRQLKALELLCRIWQEEQDITVVTHETAHQLAGQSGLFPDRVGWPSWIHEGLATYFESPKNATWSGIGAVNSQRMEWYRALEKDREHSNIEFIVGDKIFKFAGSHGSILHGYGQAWALTHFLMDRHFDKLIEFYRKLSLMPRDIFLSPELVNSVFDSVFDPKDRKNLDMEWRQYMSRLKTDFQIAISER